MLRDIPKGLANTVRSIYEKSVKEHIEAKQDEIQRINALREAAKAHTVPKTEKEKKLAALADDGKKDVITHADVMKGRGVTKEAWEDMIKAVKDAAKPQPNGGAGIKKGRAYGGANQKDTKPVKEEVVQADEAMSHQAATTMKHVPNASPALKKAAKDIKPGVAGYRDRIDMLKAGGVKEEAEVLDELKAATVAKYQDKAFDKYMGGDNKRAQGLDRASKKQAGAMGHVATTNEEAMDTPGNSTHQCAVHVKSEQFGEGKALFSQHAEPAEDGSIEWYDIMFEHGIEKKVPTASLEILVSEGHMNHKKKKAA